MVRNPIIPTSITVHLGRPSESAKNVTVPFVEYIKNVASGEIYPNWPEDAIKANVLAQISFALNRIYNEWYPSQGYSFDITSSPEYDQSFREDRQFFERISVIVDEFFNDYIVKEGQVQPFFAQYCDGKNTTCDGLSQWGSVSLANQGKSPLEILRSYYGKNIKLVYDAPVEENIASYPGFPLSFGSAADYVRTIKIQLNRIGQNYPAIPVIIDDSIYFTVEMENAIKKFQEIFSLPVTGMVDKTTWYKIKYLYNAVKRIANLYSEGISISEAELLFEKNLQLGSTGEYISVLNYLLNVIAYFDQDIPFYDLRGDTFTEKTKEMVIAFQNKYQLPPNGIVDVRVWKDLLEAYDQTLKTIPSQYLTYISEFYPGRYLSRGMTGEDVLNLQRFLYKICEASHSIPGVVVSGNYDNLTEQSVRALQRRFGIKATGIVGPATWYNIVELSKDVK